MKHLLIVEDNIDSRLLLKKVLGAEYDIKFMYNVESAKQLLATNSKDWDAIILDRNLPDGDGVELCMELQKLGSPPPILMLTAHANTEEKLEGFTAGADDYLAKPFEPRELLARLNAILRRRSSAQTTFQSTVTFSDLTLNLETQAVLAHTPNGDAHVELTPIEFKILLALVKNYGKEIDRDHLLHVVWDKIQLSERNIDTHICHIRKKLAQSRIVIKNRRGKGYYIKDNAPTSAPAQDMTTNLPYMRNENGNAAYRSAY